MSWRTTTAKNHIGMLNILGQRDPAFLPNNSCAVEATFLRTEKQLAKNPVWKAACSDQVKDMLGRRAAVKLSESAVANWDGPVWVISSFLTLTQSQPLTRAS